MKIDNTKYVGRTLEDIIPDLPKVANGEHYFVGSKTAYFMCFGDGKDFENTVDTVSEKVLTDFKKMLKRYKDSLSKVRKPVKGEEETEEDFQTRIKMCEKRKDLLRQEIALYTGYINNFVPVRKREVKEVFMRNGLDFSCCILVEGDEAGRFIDYSEYEKTLHRQKKVEAKEEPPLKNVYMGKRKPIAMYKRDGRYNEPYNGKIPKNLGKLYKSYVDGKSSLANLAAVARIHKSTLRLIFYKIQRGEIAI